VAELRALVVDDSKVGRLTMLRKLEPLGIQVDLAAAGQEALDYLAHQRPDLIFMDHMMPEMDGFEVTRRIKATPGLGDIPVIMVSGNDEAAFVDEARAAGAIDAIAKPPPPGVLEKLLARLPRTKAPVEAARQPERMASEPTGVAAFDQDALRAWLEQQLEVALAPLRDALRSELAQGFGARLEAHARALDELSLGGRERLDESRAGIAALRAELQTIVVRLEEGLRAARASGQAGLDDHAVAVAQRLTMFEGRLEDIAAEPARLGEFQAALLARQEDLRAMVAAEHEAQASRLAERQAQLLAGLDEARSRLASLEQQRDNLAMPEAEVKAEVAAAAVAPLPAPLPTEQPVRSDTGLQDDLARLKRKLHALTLALAIGGGALLVAVGMLLLKGY